MSAPALSPTSGTSSLTAAASGTASPTTTAARPRIVIAGAGRAAQALVRQLTRTPFAGAITVLSNRDDAPEELLELAVLPQVSVRFGQPASYIDAENRRVTTADGMEFDYDELVIATGSAPAEAPVEGAARCLSYSTIDDAAGLGEAVKDVTRVLGRRPLGILVGTGSAAGQAEAVLRARGVRPVRTTRPPRRRRSHPRRVRPAGVGHRLRGRLQHERRPRGPRRGAHRPRRTGRHGRARRPLPAAVLSSARTSAPPCRASGRSVTPQRSTASGWGCSWPPVRRLGVRFPAASGHHGPAPGGRRLSVPGRPGEASAGHIPMARWSPDKPRTTRRRQGPQAHKAREGTTASPGPPGKGPP